MNVNKGMSYKTIPNEVISNKTINVHETCKLLKELREGTGMSVRQIAEVLGVETVTVYKWEKSHIPSIDNLFRLAEFYGCNIEDLLVRD